MQYLTMQSEVLVDLSREEFGQSKGRCESRVAGFGNSGFEEHGAEPLIAVGHIGVPAPFELTGFGRGMLAQFQEAHRPAGRGREQFTLPNNPIRRIGRAAFCG